MEAPTTPPSPSSSMNLSIPLPRSLSNRIYIHLTLRAKAITLFVTTSNPEDAAAAGTLTPLGSFVYALPDRYNPSNPPLSTPLITTDPTQDFTARLARILARKAQLPVYVGGSVTLNKTGTGLALSSSSSGGIGGSVEEEMEALKSIVDVVVDGLKELASREKHAGSGGQEDGKTSKKEEEEEQEQKGIEGVEGVERLKITT